MVLGLVVWGNTSEGGHVILRQHHETLDGRMPTVTMSNDGVHLHLCTNL